MNIKPILTVGKALLGAVGLVGSAAWTGIGLHSLVVSIEDQIRENRRKRRMDAWDQGYKAATNALEFQIEMLRRENRELLEKSIKQSEGTE